MIIETRVLMMLLLLLLLFRVTDCVTVPQEVLIHGYFCRWNRVD